MISPLKVTDEVIEDLARVVALASAHPDFKAKIGIGRATDALAAVIELRQRARGFCNQAIDRSPNLELLREVLP